VIEEKFYNIIENSFAKPNSDNTENINNKDLNENQPESYGISNWIWSWFS
jgi:hypothetical protein